MKTGISKRITAYLLVLAQSAGLGLPWTAGLPVYAESAVYTRSYTHAYTSPAEGAEAVPVSTPASAVSAASPSGETAVPEYFPISETAETGGGEARGEKIFALPVSSPLSEAVGESASALIRAGEGGVVVLENAEIKIPPGALETDTEISITRLFVTEATGETLSNATAGGGGYRFLPAGLQFKKPAVVRLPYDAALAGRPAALRELSSYYYHTETKQWEALNRIGLDEERRQLISETTHFTDMINGTLSLPEGPKPLSFDINSIKGLEAADPSAGVIPLEGLEANYTGSAGFRFALPVPPGRAGMVPSVALSYSSDGGNGILGRGFSLETGGEITYDTRRGLPDYYAEESRKGRFLLDGVRLRYAESEGGGVYRYRPLKEQGFERIRHYTSGGDWWEVTDKNGTSRLYGRAEAHAVNGTNYGPAWTGTSAAAKYRWLLERVTDSFGNTIHYEYTIDHNEAYLRDIYYTGTGDERGPYRVHFVYDEALPNQRPDIQVNGRGKFIAETRKRLDRIETLYGGQLIKSWRMDYGIQKYYGYTQMVRFGEDALTESGQRIPGEYLWAYEFDYENFEKDGGGQPVLFGPQEPWDFDGAIQEQQGESGGGNGSASAGFGVGKIQSIDLRATAAKHFGSTRGDTETEKTLADINGDGRPDSVWIRGNAVIACLNNGNGFDPELSMGFLNGDGPGFIGKESQRTSTDGYSIFGGGGFRKFSLGLNYGYTRQESWSDEETGFSDINGDGLADLVLKGADYYWRNTGHSFVKTGYGTTGAGLPADLERELTDGEVKEYDGIYYQQAPLRAWRIPLDGTVRVSQRIQPADSRPLTGDGIRVYLYRKSEPLWNAELAGENRMAEQSTAHTMTAGEALYFVSDAGSDIQSTNEAGDDIEWNIRIQYESIRYFEELNRRGAFFIKTNSINRDTYNSLPWGVRRLYERKKIPETNPPRYHYVFKNLSMGSIRNWAEQGWLNDDLFIWIVDRGQVIPGVLSREHFAVLAEQAKDAAYSKNPWSPPDLPGGISETPPSPVEALFGYYQYDAGRDAYYYNEAMKGELDNQDSVFLAANIAKVSVDERTAFIENMRSRSWRHMESQILDLIPPSRRREFMSARLPGREDPVFPKNAGGNSWYYGEGGNETAPEESGRYLGRVFHIDTIDGDKLLLDTVTGAVDLGGENIGIAAASEPGETWDLTVQGNGYKLYYRFSGFRAWKDTLSPEEVEALVEAIEARAWEDEEAWKTLDEERYTALLAHAAEAEAEEAVSGAYEKQGAGYIQKTSLGGEEKEALRIRIAAFAGDTFLSCYTPPEEDDGDDETEENPNYLLKTDLSAQEKYILNAVSGDYGLTRWTAVTRKVRYYDDGLFPVEDNIVRFFSIGDDAFTVQAVDISESHSWDSGKDFSTRDLVSDGVYHETRYTIDYTGADYADVEFPETQPQEEEVVVQHRAETIETLYGGYKQWCYGIWLGGQTESSRHNGEAFSEEKLYRDRNKGKNQEQVNQGTDGDEPPMDKDSMPVFVPVDIARLVEFEGEQTWTIVSDAETGKQIAEAPVLAGPVFVTQQRVEGVIKDKRFAPWISGDILHTNRAGGTAYAELPGMRAQTPPGGLTMTALNKSYSDAKDKVWTPGAGYAFLKGNLSHGNNNNQTRLEQTLQDINGDGYADIIQYRENGEGKLSITPGYNGIFGGLYQIAGGGYPSRNESDTTTTGGSISAGGSLVRELKPRGGERGINITGGGGGGITGSNGSNKQTAGLVDINGDGLPDYLSNGGAAINVGEQFRRRDDSLETWNYGLIGSGKSRSNGISLSLSPNLSGGEGPGVVEENTAGFDMGLSGSLNLSSSHSSSYHALLDMNGDGLPDRVRKEPDGSMTIAYGLGSTFNNEWSFAVDDWHLGGGEQYGVEEFPRMGGFERIPYFGVSVLLTLRAHMAFVKSFLDSKDINALDFTGSLSWGLSGGLNMSFQLTFYIPDIFGGFYINIPIGNGGAISWNASSSQVTMRTMDIDGDGLPDRVLRVSGSDHIYVKRNLAGEVGLLKTVTAPQGGTTSLEYEYMPGTADMPQSKYVLAKVTQSDGDGTNGRIQLQYDSEHQYTTEFEYDGGWYDRQEKESYGFATVITKAPDGTTQVTQNIQREYHLKGMPSRQLSYNSGWSSETIYTYDNAPYALVTGTQTTLEEGGKTMRSTLDYQYDGYGNVRRITDAAAGVDTLTAEISYWHNDGKYFHAHPTEIAVKSNGNTIRRRTGSYDNSTGALTSQTAHDGRNTDITTHIDWDQWGNLARLENGAWVGYSYDGEHHQYPETITRGGSGAQYSSRIEWDKRRGVKTREVDENGQEISYVYDQYGRLTEVYSPYDTAMPAVKYDYLIPEEGNWYAVTENKVSFDPGNSHVLRTVIVIDGLGRAIVTGKDGAVWKNGGDIEGWNIAGGVSYDNKGRTIAQGQPEFIEGTDIDRVLNYEYQRRDGAYGLRLPTVTEYDTQDRPVKVTLPDNSVQTTAYAILDGGKSLVTAIDPLGNIAEQTADSRGNIVEVRRKNNQNILLTRASYEYNAIGEMLKAIDVKGFELTVEYDWIGRRTAMQSADMGRKEYYFDAHGNLFRENDNVLRGKGTEIKYVYDGLNRLVRIDYPQSEDTVYEYGPPTAIDGTANRIKKITDETGTTEYQYGALGETVKETRTIKILTPEQDAEKTRAIGYQSNYLGQMETITYYDDPETAQYPETVRYQYNAGGQIRSVTGYKDNTASGTFEYVNTIGYDEFGQRVFIEYGNGVKTAYTYNPERRWLDKIVTTDGYDNTVIQNMTYTLDRVGNVAGYNNEADLYTTEQSYSYDDLYQLITVNGSSMGYNNKSHAARNFYSVYSQSFAFDGSGNGNMTGKTSTEKTHAGVRNGDSLNYNLDYQYYDGYAHRAKKIGNMYYTYDGNGNLAAEQFGSPAAATANNALVSEENGIYSTDYGFALIHPDTQNEEKNVYRRNYLWNERNQLVRSVDDQYTVEYRYGADGNRANKFARRTGFATETLYFNRMYQVNRENTKDAWVESKHIFVGDTRIVTKRTDEGNDDYGQEKEEQYFYHGDHLGSAQMVTGCDGRVYEHLEYTPYGELWVEHAEQDKASVDKTVFRFTGKERDGETGLYYYGARYLNPQTGLWLSTDPAMGEYVPQAPINDEAKKANGNLPGMGGVFNTVNLHLYHYAGNNPVKYVDPDGRLDIEGAVQHEQNAQEWQRRRIEDIKTGKIGTFTQGQWATVPGLGEGFAKYACAATTLLNAVARAYTLESGKEMSFEIGAQIMLSTVRGAKKIDEGGWVKSMPEALEHMAQKAGIRGRIWYVDNGTNEMWKIYTWLRGYALDENGVEKLDEYGKKIELTHFINGAGNGNVFDVYDGVVKSLNSRSLTTERNTRGINYYLPYQPNRRSQ